MIQLSEKQRDGRFEMENYEVTIPFSIFTQESMAVILNTSAGARQTQNSDAELNRARLPPSVGCLKKRRAVLSFMIYPEPDVGGIRPSNLLLLSKEHRVS